MSWYSRVTRYGDSHIVYAQEADQSCGIACVLMTVFKVNKLIPGKKAVRVEKKIYDVYEEVDGTPYDGTRSSRATRLAMVLNKLNVGTWEAKNVGVSGVGQVLVDSLGVEVPGQSLFGGPGAYVANQLKPIKPVIVLVKWTSAGGHFVVVDTVNQTPFGMYASACDPWDGNVHITEFTTNSPFNYVGAKVPLSWDLGGKRNEYDSASTGASNGWIVRQIS